jgi:hypothetical protein
VLDKPGASHADGRDKGARIPNFNDDFFGSAPDIGAHEFGAATRENR